jgi:hypothetical protein
LGLAGGTGDSEIWYGELALVTGILSGSSY